VKKKINRKKILEKLVEFPTEFDKRFLIQELAILKRLERKYSIDFWEQFTPEKKFPTLKFYYSEFSKKTLEIAFKEFYYNSLHKSDLSEAEKIGKDFKAKPKQTIKDFLS
jgi:hypothetical protein